MIVIIKNVSFRIIEKIVVFAILLLNKKVKDRVKANSISVDLPYVYLL